MVESSNAPATLNQVIGDWGKTHLLVFGYVQYTYLMYGWMSLQMAFLTPDVQIQCSEGQLSSQRDNNATHVDVCSEQCSQRIVSHDVFQSTITEKFGLVCDRHWLQSFSTTILMVSGMIANLVAGDLADRFGRKKTVLLFLIPDIAGSLFMLFARNYAMFAVGVALVGMGYVSVANFAYLLLFELSGVSQRSAMGISVELGFNLGAVLLGGVAWAMPDWFHIQIVCSALTLLLAVAWFLPESPAWLIEKQRVPEAVETMLRIAKLNNNQYQDKLEIEELVKNLSGSREVNLSCKVQESNFWKEFRYKAISISYIWFVAAFVFYGFSLNVSIFGNGLFLSFILAALSAVPSIAVILLLSRVMKVKWMIVLVNGFTSAICFLYWFGESLHWYRTASVVLGWFFSSPGLVMLYTFTSDLFPTRVRGRALGLGNFMSRLGAALAPFVKELGAATHDYVPMFLFCGMCAISILVVVHIGKGEEEYDLDQRMQTRIENNDAVDLNRHAIVVGFSQELSNKINHI